MGPAGLPLADVVAELLSALPGVDLAGGRTERQADILWKIRMPRVVLGGLVGGTLALSGAAYQGVFRNPLADPYLLGVAAGAGLGATLAIAYGPNSTSWAVDALPLFAFVGALLGVGLAWAIGQTTGAGRDVASLILAGVAVAAFLTAIQTFVPSNMKWSSSSTLSQCSRGIRWMRARVSLAKNARSDPSMTCSQRPFHSSPATGSAYSCSTRPTEPLGSRQ